MHNRHRGIYGMIVVIGHADVTARDELHRAAKSLPMTVRALASSLRELREAVRITRPDIVIVDWQLDENLAGFIRELTALPGHPRVVVAVRGPITLELWRAIRSAGAIGVLTMRDANAIREGLARLLVLDKPSSTLHNRHEDDTHQSFKHLQTDCRAH